MSALHGEARRLLADRPSLLLIAAGGLIALALTAGLALLGPEHMNPPMPGLGTPEGVRGSLGLLVLAAPVPFLLGSRSMTREFEHGTIIPTLLAQPRRARLVGTKLAVMLGAGLAYGVVLAACSWVGVELGAIAQGVELGLPRAEILRMASGLGLGSALYTLLGAAVGALLQRSIWCLGAAIGWLYLGESLIPALPGGAHLYPWMPGGAASSLTGYSFIAEGLSATLGSDPVRLLPAWAGISVLLAYAGVAVAVAFATTLRRDIR